jgi:DNA-binding Xre family transcriptional regulator
VSGKLDYRWRLREVMATRGIFSTTALRPLLAERGVQLSPSQIYRLVVDKPERLNLSTFMALLDILDCRMEDLVEPAAAAPSRAAAAGHAGEACGEGGVGSFRPRRARVIPPSQDSV